ncbi:SDR family NAD(P)-dependent oxidoreductase [Geodermatophilus sp. SYSU D00758]
MVRLSGAVVLVTGGSSGIGRAVAELLGRRGAAVVVSGRDARALEETAARCGGTALPADLRDPGAAAGLVDRVVAASGRLDGVVAAAGTGHVGPVAGMTGEEVAALVDLNTRATLDLARAAVAAFAAAPAPRERALCLVTSVAGRVGVPGETVYSATKAAVEAFAALLHEELRDAGVRVATVAPGVVDTPFLARRAVPYDRRVPRPVPPERVARAVVAALEGGPLRRTVPRWLALPAWLSAALPGPYRALARRLS